MLRAGDGASSNLVLPRLDIRTVKGTVFQNVPRGESCGRLLIGLFPIRLA